MKFDVVERKHIIEAAEELDKTFEIERSDYWIKITEKQKEYPFKYLIRIALEKASGQKISADYFQSNPYYRNYIEENFDYEILYKIPPNTAFFNRTELDFFSLFAGKPYRKNIQGDIEAGVRIKETIYKKTNVWGKALNIKGFEVELDNLWQISGFFKKYSWVTIYRKEHKNPRIFFTVGISAISNGLAYKIDCQRKRKNALTKEQIKIFDLVIKETGAERSEISFDELKEYNWEKLIEVTKGFIEHYIPLYDEAYNAVFHSEVISPSETTRLYLKDTPKGKFNSIPARSTARQGNSNPDYDSENKRKKEIGDAGEQLVLAEEKNYLRSKGREDLAKKVHKAFDWEGFDIMSYDLDENEKLIEVKTTTGSALRPFVFTRNEKLTMQQNSNKYCLYRLYYFDEALASANCFILKGDFTNDVIEEPLKYNIYIKKT